MGSTPDKLLSDYKKKIEPILPLAKKAYGSRSHTTPAHVASRKYTQLLVEYYKKGGSLVAMAKELNVAYAGVRRRVLTADDVVAPSRKKSSLSDKATAAAIERVKKAKEKSTDAYHAQIASEYEKGLSLAKLAAGLGISSSQPLYWAVKRAEVKSKDEK